jgi:beta-phosphoglucomutase-like phosphatase (HAD superfamily)
MRIKWIGLFLLLMADCMSEIKAILFDCDGTLVDSEWAHYTGWKKALNDFGSDLSVEEYCPYVGKSAQINALLLAESKGIDLVDLDHFFTIKTDYYLQLCEAGVAPIAPTVAFLQKLVEEKHRLGLKIGVCSAARREHILIHLKNLQIDHLFDIVLSGQEDLTDYSDPEGVNKPKPYIYQHAVNNSRIKAEALSSAVHGDIQAVYCASWLIGRQAKLQNVPTCIQVAVL